MVAHLLNLHATIDIAYDLQASDNNYAQFISLEPSLFNKNTELNIAHFCYYYYTATVNKSTFPVNCRSVVGDNKNCIVKYYKDKRVHPTPRKKTLEKFQIRLFQFFLITSLNVNSILIIIKIVDIIMNLIMYVRLSQINYLLIYDILLS